MAQFNLGNSQWQGQLNVVVKETRGLPIQGVGCYCILQLEKQQIQTKALKVINKGSQSSYEPLNDTFLFDVTDPSSSLIIEVYGGGNLSQPQWLDNSDGVLLGSLSIPIQNLSPNKPIEQWFKLSSSRSCGEIGLRLLFVQIKTYPSVEDFEPLTLVGRGTFAKVMLVRKKDSKRLYAMKVIRKDQVIKHNAVKHTMSEKNVLTRIKHPFIVSLKYSFQTESKLYMILDYIGGGELFYHLSEAEKFPEPRAKFYAAEITVALGYLHKYEIVYRQLQRMYVLSFRDLKPENLLLDINGHICITDFGLCKEGLSFGRVTHTFCGSPEYLAPEILEMTGYEKSVDWWALGTLLYEMIAGLPPFFSEDPDEMNRNILNAPLSFSDDFSPQARILLIGLLAKNPQKRLGYGIRDADEIKEQDFFKGIDWMKLENREIEPPFRPNLKSETDVRFFDPESTAQRARHSVDQGSLSNQEQALFEGFTYVAPELSYSRRRGSSGAKQIHKPLLINEDRPKRDFLSNHRFLETNNK